MVPLRVGRRVIEARTPPVFMAERPPERPERPHEAKAEWSGPASKQGRVVCTCGYVSEFFHGRRAEVLVTALMLSHKRVHRDP